MWSCYLCISCLLYITYVLRNLLQLLTFISNLTKEPKKCEKSFYLNPMVLQLHKKGGCFIALWRKENILGGLSYDFSEMSIKNFCCLLLKYFQSQIKRIQQTVQGHRSQLPYIQACSSNQKEVTEQLHLTTGWHCIYNIQKIWNEQGDSNFNKKLTFSEVWKLASHLGKKRAIVDSDAFLIYSQNQSTSNRP